jgi:hypothetical protein
LRLSVALDSMKRKKKGGGEEKKRMKMRRKRRRKKEGAAFPIGKTPCALPIEKENLSASSSIEKKNQSTCSVYEKYICNGKRERRIKIAFTEITIKQNLL